jgi:hypothetical protein
MRNQSSLCFKYPTGQGATRLRQPRRMQFLHCCSTRFMSDNICAWCRFIDCFMEHDFSPRPLHPEVRAATHEGDVRECLTAARRKRRNLPWDGRPSMASEHVSFVILIERKADGFHHKFGENVQRNDSRCAQRADWTWCTKTIVAVVRRRQSPFSGQIAGMNIWIEPGIALRLTWPDSTVSALDCFVFGNWNFEDDSSLSVSCTRQKSTEQIRSTSLRFSGKSGTHSLWRHSKGGGNSIKKFVQLADFSQRRAQRFTLALGFQEYKSKGSLFHEIAWRVCCIAMNDDCMRWSST